MAKNGFVAAFDKLPWIVKLIFCIPALNILWALYRIIKGATQGNALMLIMGILWIIPGCFICWLIDLICVILYKRPTVFA
jgi:hypothetical protein